MKNIIFLKILNNQKLCDTQKEFKKFSTDQYKIFIITINSNFKGSF